jgi:hypothetical protein
MKFKIFIILTLLGFHNVLFAQQKGEPFQNIDQTWQNGNDRRDSSIFNKMKYFIPSILIDISYTHSFNNPNDNTVVGSTALARNNEIQLQTLNVGGEFNYNNTRAKIMTQFGTKSQLIPRNDYSSYKGQYNLQDVYRYLSETYVGYHINKWYGINIDAGLFMSYIGLNSYYQAENWEYQASFTSDNTPWFFNGIRTQIYPTKNLKLEIWIINGWQSYAQSNNTPGIGGSITYLSSNSNLKLISNNYIGKDAPLIPNRKRFHSDNSTLIRYINKPKSNKITKAAISITSDIGCEFDGGVNGFHNSNLSYGPSQYFFSYMIYNRIWFNKDKLAWTLGGGYVNNPGRYLILPPTGQASPLPNPNNPSQTEGTNPFSMNPGDKFKGWDISTNISYMPNQMITLRLEYVHRQSNVDYFAGYGGVTSQTGYTTSTPNNNWKADLTKSENRIILALLFRI